MSEERANRVGSGHSVLLSRLGYRPTSARGVCSWSKTFCNISVQGAEVLANLVSEDGFPVAGLNFDRQACLISLVFLLCAEITLLEWTLLTAPVPVHDG